MEDCLRSRLIILSVLAVFAVGCSQEVAGPGPRSLLPDKPSAAVADYSDGGGKTWRQPVSTTSLSWNQVAQVCPRDGVSPCMGSIGNKDLTAWVWATAPQVIQLFSTWAPEILTNPTPTVNSVFAGIGLVNIFYPTQWFANTYSSSEYVSGWTSSKDANGAPLAGGGGWSTPPHAGGIGVGPIADPDEAIAARGVFLWRADGSDGRTIVANPDAGAVPSPNGGTVVANVLANDLLVGAPATVATVTIAQVSSSHPGVTVDPSDGSVDVAVGTPAGMETLTYRICETANPTLCAQAAVTVTITGNVIDAVDDAGSAKTGGGIGVANLLANDTFAGGQATLQNVDLSQVSPDPFLAIAAGGALGVLAGTPAGTHDIDYQICEIGNPTNCDQATARVTVSAYVVDAVDDQGAAPSSPGGTAVATVLVNDRFDGAAASLARITLSLVSSSHAGITLDLGNGSVDVASGTPGGAQSLIYRICETASPANCDQATVAIAVAPQSYIVSKDRHRINEGTGGSFTVKLSQPPSAPVTVAVSYLAGTINVTFSPATLTFTAANWNVAQAVTFATIRDSNKEDNAGTLQLTSAGLASRHVVVNGIDKDRKTTAPVPILHTPYNGETVKGLVSLWGTATSTGGVLVDAKFSVDGVRHATVVNASGSYRPTDWNTAVVSNGWHTLELRVTDATGNDGRTTIKVFVNN